jgi:hypothetical protein
VAEFPVLKTGAITQYPAARSLHFETEVVRFLDGAEQRFRKHKAALRRWVIRLDLLSDEEMYALEAFFTSEQGRFGEFGFTDPHDNTHYPKCSFESDSADFKWREILRGQTMLVIRQNWS